MSKKGYEQIIDGRWYDIPRRDNWEQCCDCGLVHVVHYRLRKGKLQYQVFRHPRATNGARKGFKFTKDE